MIRVRHWHNTHINWADLTCVHPSHTTATTLPQQHAGPLLQQPKRATYHKYHEGNNSNQCCPMFCGGKKVAAESCASILYYSWTDTSQGGASARLSEVNQSLAGTLLPPPTSRLSAYWTCMWRGCHVSRWHIFRERMNRRNI